MIEDYIDNYLYDMNDYLIQHIHKELDPSTMQPENIYRKDYFDFETFDSHLGLESNNEEKISIYPNPMRSECIIDLSQLDEKVHSVNLFNSAGGQILGISVPENQKMVLTDEKLQSGFYLVIIETDTRTIQSRIVVE